MMSQRANRQRVPVRAVSVALLLLGATLSPPAAQAQSYPDDWEWRATVYGWLPDLDGKTIFPTGTDGPEIEVDASELIDNLDFTFQAAFHGHKGRWGLFTDVLYLDEGGSKSQVLQRLLGPGGGLPFAVELDARLDVKSWLWTVGGSYTLSRSDDHLVDWVVGARMIDMTQELAWHATADIAETPLTEQSGSSRVSGTNWDDIVGLKGFRRFGNWVVPWEFDVGAGDSDLVWQAMAGIGYRFGWGELLLNYRYLDYENDENQPVSDLTLSGPMVAASFSW